MPLSDAQLRAAKARDKLYKLSDSGGLQLHVTPAGGKLWRLAYRYDGKQKTLSFGPYPAVGLAEARQKRDEAKRALLAGRDPARAPEAPAAATFKQVALEWREKAAREGLAGITLEKIDWLLDMAFEQMGARPIGEIGAPELLLLLRSVERRGHFESAKRLRSVCGRVFRYGIAIGVAERDVAADLRDALTNHQAQHRAAILDPDHLGRLLADCYRYKGHAVTRAALIILPMVFTRPIELRHALWSEFDFDSALWRIPAEKMKMRRPHLVPLAKQVVERLREMPRTSAYVFPSMFDAKKPISENTINGAMRALGYAKDEVCSHGFRRTASTMLNEAGFNSDWIEKQLAHQSGGVRGIYNAAEYLDGRRQMMQWWADYLDRLRESCKSHH